jgi:hypothetical protein
MERRGPKASLSAIAYSGQLSFAADTGTLKLDDSANGFVLKHHSCLDRFDSRK